MRRTIYLPDDLAERAEAHLRERPGLTFSTLVQDALAQRLAPPNPAAILDLAGLVTEASVPAGQQAEDRFVRHER